MNINIMYSVWVVILAVFFGFCVYGINWILRAWELQSKSIEYCEDFCGEQAPGNFVRGEYIPSSQCGGDGGCCICWEKLRIPIQTINSCDL